MRRTDGFSILEVIISLGIFMMLIIAIISLEVSVFQNNRLAESRTQFDQQSLIVLHDFTAELRTAQVPHDGSFPIDTATDSEVSFYSDLNGDGVVEKVRYFVAENKLQRGVIIPTGEPLTNDPLNEVVVSRIASVVNDPPYFQYYDESYNATTATTSLTLPVNTSVVRIVEMRIPVSIKNTSEPRIFSTSAMVRTLRTH